MRKRYIVLASPAIAAITIGWLMPLVVYGHSALYMDGGGRVLDENGVCCMEPTLYYIARVTAIFSPLVVVICLVAILTVRLMSKKR